MLCSAFLTSQTGSSLVIHSLPKSLEKMYIMIANKRAATSILFFAEIIEVMSATQNRYRATVLEEAL